MSRKMRTFKGIGYCRMCNRRLTDPHSVEAGIGPVCAGKERQEESENAKGENEHNTLSYNAQTGDIIFYNEGDACFTNVPRVLVVHSPTGYEWGYGGSGPADFAMNIMRLFVGPEKAKMPELYQDFKWKFIATANRDATRDKPNIIKGDTIRAWLREKGFTITG